ncbi:hypothetical protein [Bacillus marinisedimentorum]|uniref:hypothetical protein n=1 Tax=Bacillus marinisedimentorum TaxID=1821260 RepID=UPI000872C334|nr:hypothetical protein [Bacillus marinisedimentorum]
MRKEIKVFSGLLITAFVFVIMSRLYGGKQIRTYEELENAFPVLIGFPIGFIELKWPKIDPLCLMYTALTAAEPSSMQINFSFPSSLYSFFSF